LNGWTVAGLCALYVLVWIPIAYLEGVLFPSQMLKRYRHFQQCIPLVADFYVWADLIILSPLIGFINSEIREQWRVQEMYYAFLIGSALALFFQMFVVVPGKYPSSLGGAGETTLVGVLHVPFMGLALGMIGLFAITPVSTATTIIVTVALAVLIPTVILVPLHFFRKWTGYAWVPDVFGEEPRLFWMIGLAWLALAIGAIFKLYFQ
jgi:hypothetical protein